jgi:ElaA protein
MEDIQWQLKNFSQLKNTELYKIIQLRAAVFVVEQNCPYNDLDNLDIDNYHFCAWQNQQIMAYTRLLAPGVAYPNYCSIGRVISAPQARGLGLGQQIVAKSIQNCRTLYPSAPIKIGAQKYLQKFYQQFGFEQVGDEYLEDNIPHLPMLLK